MVAPDDNRADRGTTGIRAVMGPRARKVVFRAWVATHLCTHVPAAPSGWTASISMRIAMMRIMMMRIVMMGPGLGVRGKRAKQSRCSHDLTHKQRYPSW